MALSRSGPWTASAVLLVGVLAAWTAWTRLGAVARGTAWAEDGGLFLRERIAFGPVDTLLRPYAGYLHLGPRSVVDAALLFPVDRYALAVSAICCCLVGAVCAGVFVLARDAVPSWPLRLVLAAVPVLLPAAPLGGLRHGREPAHLRPVPGTVVVRVPRPDLGGSGRAGGGHGPGRRHRGAGGPLPAAPRALLAAVADRVGRACRRGRTRDPGSARLSGPARYPGAARHVRPPPGAAGHRRRGGHGGPRRS
ncbi:hypothetical protein [Curtobacterium sp. MCJR17_043]|uniref:hypothetical protein n=1 Tax=Curtobacterium sp. MCJR17_043 TaxID=2175660 RepID=UPI0024DF9B43|nr:hypothetical protein [Curtobacterium sp. MCJR17_043]WIB35267.1 hypothetical protein DEJ15_13095 [Curtobacterium sp. MCJR17_043]